MTGVAGVANSMKNHFAGFADPGGFLGAKHVFEIHVERNLACRLGKRPESIVEVKL
jgi:hypothetical protein